MTFAAIMLGHTASVAAQSADIRLVALPSASLADTETTLPASVARFLNNDNFVVEMWVQTPDARGLASVSVDIAFTGALADVTNIAHFATFGVLTAGTIDDVSGIIDNLSGSHLGSCADAIAVSPKWARVAVLSVTASASGGLNFQSSATGSAIYGTAICGVGNLADAQIAFGQVSVELVECLTDADCDDAQFCNGAETCSLSTFSCQPSTPPLCDDAIGCTLDICDPAAGGGAGRCVFMPDDTHCDDLLFCNGIETCDAIQGCVMGMAPCAAACEHCIEATEACELCVLDLDGSGVMGTGDFSLFVPCFGACYGLGHPCLESNLDEDVDGCVGTSDFAAFVGCFGSSCEQCAGCAGPGSGDGLAGAAGLSNALDTTAVLVRLVARNAPGTSDLLEALPPSDTAYTVGDPIYLEVWVALQDQSAGVGFASAYVDLQFDLRRLALVRTIPSKEFGLLLSHPGNPEGRVLRALGGCAQLNPQGIAADGSWVRVTTVATRAIAPGRSFVTLRASDQLHGFSRAGMLGNIDPSRIALEGVMLKVHRKPGGSRSGR